MCGIAGIFNYLGTGPTISEALLTRMSDEIAHRGPDDSGVFISSDRLIGLAFRRLAIVDLSSAGHQPMSTDDGSIWIVFNGEIYNHLEIRNDLESKGYRYHSRTDTETILYAYQEYGINFITKLYGMFAIAIWDSRIKQLLLIRDRIGIKPLYYTFQRGSIFFSSEIKAILTHPQVPRILNEHGLYDYLSFLTTPPDLTLFDGIHKLEAGHYLTIKIDGSIRKQQYWDINHETETYSRFQYEDEVFCIEQIRRLLRNSVKLRMMSDVPFGVLLSGGIDSSLNVALMSELMTRPVETFSVGYKDLENYNELGFARQVSDRFATNHHEMLLDEQDLLGFLPRMVWHQDEPNADPVCVPMYFVSQLARDSGTIVVQVGEGSDEQFAGYLHYLREMRYFRYFHSAMPDAVKQLVYRSLKAFQPNWVATDYARRAANGDSPFYGGAVVFTEELKSRLLSPQFRNRFPASGRIPLHYMQNEALSAASAHPNPDYLSKMIYFEFKNRLPELLLMRVDKMSMAASIEARVPFLDHRLVEFSARIPQSLKLKAGVTKYILKKSAEGIIPNEVIYRKKQGFAAPIREWFRSGRLKHFAYERIFESELTKLGIFQTGFIDMMFKEHIGGKNNYERQLWSILIVCMWYDTFISQKSQ
jgi:asparagine synthase (glutamine-hydrolysing)